MLPVFKCTYPSVKTAVAALRLPDIILLWESGGKVLALGGCMDCFCEKTQSVLLKPTNQISGTSAETHLRKRRNC